MHFRNRREAGRQLAGKLAPYVGRTDVVVLALPRGGVPVGFEVAEALKVPLDLFLVRKLGVPGQEELAMGAIAPGGVRILNDHVLAKLHISPEDIERVAERETRELQRREASYRGDRPAVPVRGRVCILVDDGLATGSTMRAAVAALRHREPAKVIVAIPVAAEATVAELRREADEVVFLLAPEPFYAVGEWYENFEQTTDAEVIDLISQAHRT